MPHIFCRLNSRKSLRAMAHASEEKRFDINACGAFILTPRPDVDTSSPIFIPKGQQGIDFSFVLTTAPSLMPFSIEDV
jgi:hypothetical protein